MQELDESDYWQEILVDGQYVSVSKLRRLRDETNELMAIFVTMVVNAKKRPKK